VLVRGTPVEGAVVLTERVARGKTVAAQMAG
jgi:hypothetical protein